MPGAPVAIERPRPFRVCSPSVNGGAGRVAYACLAITALLGCAGEPRVLEPRAPPPRATPAVQLPSAPPRPGEGRVVLDTVGEPMRVTVQADLGFVPPGAPTTPSRTGELCLTPCAADLPFGRYRLFLSSPSGEHGDADDLTVGEGLTIYRRAPGKYVTPSVANRAGPIVVIVLGLALASVGLTIASATAANNGSPAPALVLGGAGLAAAAVGWAWLYDASRAIQQSGATTTWREPLP